MVQKFQQEKEALARVDHPGVVGILDTGELPDGKPYLVMQFIDGVTLRSQIKTEGIATDRAAEIIRQTGRALAVAHDKGIFHRDLKPENIMLQSFAGGEEQVKIIDFGIAKLKNSTVAPSTMTGATAGTVAYMAPEQLSGRATSAATDVYAFGAIAFEILTGRKPFNPETGFELLEMQRHGVRVSPIDLRPAVTQEANDLILSVFAPRASLAMLWRTRCLMERLASRNRWRPQPFPRPNSRRRRIRPRARLPISRRRPSPVVTNQHRSTR